MSTGNYITHPHHGLVFPAKETWKTIPRYEGYYKVSTWGRIKTLTRVIDTGNRWGTRNKKELKGRVLKPTKSTGYMQIWLHKEGKSYHLALHYLVLITFIGPRPEGLEGCHDDGDFKNNRLENLRWDTHKGNHQDRIRHGTNNAGEKNWGAKRTEEKVREIRAAYATGKYMMKEIDVMFDLPKNSARPIIRGLLWRHVK